MMMKKGFYFGWILCAALLVDSCSNSRQYVDMLNAQEKAINRLIDENEFVILKNYPENGVFQSNEFVILDNGVYLNVVDSGNGNRATQGTTTVLCRFNVKWLVEWSGTDTATVNNFQNGSEPLIYKYGMSAPSSSDSYSTTFFSTLLFSGLQHVGDSSVVKLIIPFHLDGNNQTFGGSGIPLYFSKVQYRFDIR
ncbi:MAG: DUF4827 domain-containing protein [Tannerellaceae bacterium]|jgi:hypothetical protein|nr:DUF4827 domain-containing protein [Tannerellaceae bacterium]